MKLKTRERLLTIWLWFAIARCVFFSVLWAYVELVAGTNEPPLILGLSFGAMIESALAVVMATITAKGNER